MIRCRSVMRIRFRQNDLNFGHRDHGQEANEQKEERKENSVRPDECPDIHPRRVKHAPGRREKITMQAADDDDETLEPHAGVDAHADEENDEDVVAAPLEPEELWRKRVAKEHADPPVPPVGTEDAVPKGELFVGIAAIPSHEKLH